MAIGVGSIVAIKISSAVSGSVLSPGAVTAQPPCFGVCESAGAPFTVVWADTGVKTTGLLATSVDEIEDPDGPTAGLLGKVVNIDGYDPAYNSVVVSAHKRSEVNYVLCKSIATGMYMEVLATAIEAA